MSSVPLGAKMSQKMSQKMATSAARTGASESLTMEGIASEMCVTEDSGGWITVTRMKKRKDGKK
jgi:hypothetical protein